MQLDLSFGEVEAALAELHGIASAKRTAFQARLKNILRVGLPEHRGSGRGRRGAYGPLQFAGFGFALEASQLGLAPAHVAKLAQDHWRAICDAFRRAAHGQPVFIIFDPGALWQLMDGVQTTIDGTEVINLDFASASLEVWTPDRPEYLIAKTIESKAPRMSMINVSALAANLAGTFPANGGSREGFLEALGLEASAALRRLDEARALFGEGVPLGNDQEA